MSAKEKAQMLDNYKSVIDFLFDQGARLDARDFAGYTAIMHASGHLPQPELLQHLLSKGSDPNSRSAFGTTALMSATMQQNVDEIDILLRYEADPKIPCNDGVTPFSIAQKFRHVIAVYHRHMMPEMPARKCEKCSAKGTKRCTKCRVVYYCGRDCQVGDWTNHKSRCKKYCKSHKRVVIKPIENDGVFYTQNDYRSKIMKDVMNVDIPTYRPQSQGRADVKSLFDTYNEEWNKNGNMLLKIQAEVKNDSNHNWYPNMQKDLLVYNEKRNFRCMIDCQQLEGQELLSIIRDKGIGKVKAYFWAFMEPGKPEELTIITDPIHRAQTW